MVSNQTKDSDMLGASASSITTRIKTPTGAVKLNSLLVRVHLPLQQGLRPIHCEA